MNLFWMCVMGFMLNGIFGAFACCFADDGGKAIFDWARPAVGASVATVLALSLWPIAISLQRRHDKRKA